VEEQEREVNKHINSQGTYAKHGFSARNGMLEVISQDKLEQLGLSVAKVQQDLTQFLEELQSNDGNRDETSLRNHSDYRFGSQWHVPRRENNQFGESAHLSDPAVNDTESYNNGRIKVAELEQLGEINSDNSQPTSNEGSVLSEDGRKPSEDVDKHAHSRKKMTLSGGVSRKGKHEASKEVSGHQSAHSPRNQHSGSNSRSAGSRWLDSGWHHRTQHAVSYRMDSTPPPAPRLPDTSSKQDKPRRAPEPGEGLEGQRKLSSRSRGKQEVSDKLKRVDDVPEAQLFHPKTIASHGVVSARKASAAAMRVALQESPDSGELQGRGNFSSSFHSNEKGEKEGEAMSHDGSSFVQQLSLEDLAASPHLEVKDIARKVRDRLQQSHDGMNNSRDSDEVKDNSFASVSTREHGRTHPRIAAIFRS
jgi:hypothetical protein